MDTAITRDFFVVADLAQEPHGEIAKGLHAIVAGHFKETRCPGLSVAVSVRNAIFYSEALGLADIEQGVGVNDPLLFQPGTKTEY